MQHWCGLTVLLCTFIAASTTALLLTPSLSSKELRMSYTCGRGSTAQHSMVQQAYDNAKHLQPQVGLCICCSTHELAYSYNLTTAGQLYTLHKDTDYLLMRPLLL